MTPATTSPAATTAPAGSNAGPRFLIGSPSHPSYDGRRPTTIDFSGDSTNIVGQLTWTSWGPRTAEGHGTWAEDNCQPNCAAGSITDVPATITLGTVVGGHFTTMTEHAGTLDRSYRYPSKWPVGAS